MDLTSNLASHVPSAEEIIRALGIQSARHGNAYDVVPGVALFGAGLLVGAGLALLFAPTSGRELRDEIGERASDLRERAAEALGSAAPTPPHSADTPG